MNDPHAGGHRIVVLGGYGHFGARICRGLTRNCDAELVVAGRSRVRADALVEELRQIDPTRTIRSAVLDHSASGFESDLGTLEPSIVVHAAGPYQGQNYRVAEACLQHRCHYVDLADGRGFVSEFSQLDAAARRSGVLLVTGASTLPGVSSAVVDDLGSDLSSIERIETAILPANRTERGRSTIAAVFSYVGKEIPVLDNGEWTTRYGWHDLRRIDHPACARLAGICDVPDLQLFADYYPGVKTVTFHAGLELGWQQWGMWLMAWLARLGLVSNWSNHADGFGRVSARLITLGTDIGGMQVCVAGRDGAGKRVQRTWNLTAGSNHGPEIPCIPARVVAMKLVRNAVPRRGAMPCIGLMSLGEFKSAVAEYDIDWDIAERVR